MGEKRMAQRLLFYTQKRQNELCLCVEYIHVKQLPVTGEENKREEKQYR